MLPSTRPPVPERRRVELVAMELGGRAQVAVYNLGLLIVVLGLRMSSDVALVGIIAAWLAAVAALAKCWTFPLLARLPAVERLSAAWWADPTAARD